MCLLFNINTSFVREFMVLTLIIYIKLYTELLKLQTNY